VTKEDGGHKYSINLNFHWKSDFLKTVGKKSSGVSGFTIAELIIVLAILGVLAAIAVPAYVGYQTKAKIGTATSDIAAIAMKLNVYIGDNGIGPTTLADIHCDNYLDPWGRPYKYFNLKTATGKGQMRKDRFMVPINTYFDLYSMGPDGQSVSPITAPVSKDDVIYAHDGEYIGPAGGL
jgi:general secretion pathway protein G